MYVQWFLVGVEKKSLVLSPADVQTIVGGERIILIRMIYSVT